MKIVNSIMPMSDIEALAANGQKLRVAVTKTSAQGKAAQSTTPNLMSFSTDENSVWFNGKKYGATLFKNVFGLSTSSSDSQITAALGGHAFSTISSMVNEGILFLNINNKALQYVMVRIENVGSSEGDYLHIQGFSDTSDTAYIKIRHYNGVFNVPEAVQRNNIVFRTHIIDEFAPLSDYPLSANMGKKLQDEKLAKSDVVNNLSTNSASKALSAAQGKALNERISGLGNVYRVKGTKTNLSDVLALTDAKVGDVWNVTNAFTLGGKPYPANTNVVCLVATSTSDHDENNWDPLGGTVDLSTYVPKSDIVDNLSTSDSKKPLSAKQGLALATMITELEDDKETYQLLKTLESGTLSTQSEIDAILGPYSSFNAALNAGKVIHGIYKDDINRMNTVAFSAFNDTTNSRVRMFAVLNNSTLLCIQATYSGTNWTSATTSEESFSASITIE